ncbi:MAG: sigma-70 family RNA polymerase sigma factor [Phaeodactylibacter sp.]|nr:sigma-70 family RNA polymerase sigma factor [Phaeodactylibacter sp.]
MDEDLRLVEQTLKGNQAAFEQLVQRYQHYVFTITHRVLPLREEAEEAAQDAFLKAYTMLGAFERKSKFSTWLYTIAYRTAVDTSRRKKLDSTSIDDSDTYLQIADTSMGNPAEETHQQDLSEQLQEVIQKLKPEDAMLVTLFYLHEKPVKEAAEIIGLSVSNAKTKLHRLRESLKESLTRQLKAEIQDLL